MFHHQSDSPGGLSLFFYLKYKGAEVDQNRCYEKLRIKL